MAMLPHAIPSFPDDVIILIMTFLSPVAILRLRQLSRHVSNLTHERTVWAGVYCHSSLFLPKGPDSSQSAAELEHFLIRATRLEANWNSPTPQPRRRRTIGDPDRIKYISSLLHEQYLILGGPTAFKVFDLDAPADWDRPVAEVSLPTTSTMVAYRPLTLPTGDRKSFTLAVWTLNRPQKRLTTIWEIVPNGNSAPITEIPHAHPSPTGHVRTAHDFVLMTVPMGLSGPPIEVGTELFHVPTRREYFIPSSNDAQSLLGRHYREYVVTPDFVIIMHLTVQTQTPFLEAYPLPNADRPYDPSSPPVLQKTHVGLCEFDLKEVSLIDYHRSPSPSIDAVLTLVALADRSPTGLLVFTLTLFTNGVIEYAPILHAPMDHDAIPFNLSLTSSGAGMARALSMTDTMFTDTRRNTLVKYDVRAREGEVPDVDVRSIYLGEQRGIHEISFEGFRGRICLLLDSGETEILDYV